MLRDVVLHVNQVLDTLVCESIELLLVACLSFELVEAVFKIDLLLVLLPPVQQIHDFLFALLALGEDVVVFVVLHVFEEAFVGEVDSVK
jgi:hypothetical protein